MSTARHLTYDFLEAWSAGEGLPKDWTKQPDEHQRDVWWQQYAELKQHLWARHIASLSQKEQQEFGTRTHPSLSHQFRDRAQPYTSRLREELGRLGYSAEVSLCFYHADRVVLSVTLDRTPQRGLRAVPSLFHGFEVKYRFADRDADHAS